MSWFRSNLRGASSSSSSYNTLGTDTSEQAFLNHTIRPNSPPNYPNSSSTSSVSLNRFHSIAAPSSSSSEYSPPMTTKGPVADIQDSIANLNRLNLRLDRMIQKVGTSQDNPDFRDRMQNEQITGSDLCKSTTQSLQKLASSNASNTLLPQLARDFEKEMTRFQHLLEDIEHKRQRIIENAHRKISVSSVDNAKARDRDSRQALLRSQNAQFDSTAASTNFGYGNQNNGYGYNSGGGVQQQSVEEIDFQAADVEDLERRNIQIKALEGQMLEIAEMFKDMQKLVHEQQEVLDIIDNNIVTANAHVERGHDELVEAEQLQIRARKRKCAIAICLVILAGIITLIVYFLVK